MLVVWLIQLPRIFFGPKRGKLRQIGSQKRLKSDRQRKLEKVSWQITRRDFELCSNLIEVTALFWFLNIFLK